MCADILLVLAALHSDHPAPPMLLPAAPLKPSRICLTHMPRPTLTPHTPTACWQPCHTHDQALPVLHAPCCTWAQGTLAQSPLPHTHTTPSSWLTLTNQTHLPSPAPAPTTLLAPTKAPAHAPCRFPQKHTYTSTQELTCTHKHSHLPTHTFTVCSVLLYVGAY